MRVQKVYANSGYEFALLDDEGLAIPIVTDFLAYLRARGCSPNTIVAYAHDLQHLFRFFKRANIHYQDFTPRRTLDFLQYLRAVPSRRKMRKPAPELSDSGPEEEKPTTQLAPATVNRILAAVSTFYEYLIVTEAVATDENPLRKIPDIATQRVVPRYTPFLSLTTKQRPVRRVVRVRTVQRLPRPLTDEQVTALFASLTRRRDKAIFLLMLQGGLRPGEVLNLHLDDVQYGRRRVIVRHRTDHPKGARTKSCVERVVDLHGSETRLSSLSVFFRDTVAWGWEEAPIRPLLGARDLPKRPKRIPRYIPADQLNRLVHAVRQLACPYQRAALIVARWSGARRSEIRNLELDCLDAYVDGTPRLRVPVGKGKSERLVPLHEEAASAIRKLQQLAIARRGLRDDQTGAESHRLFVYRGLLLSASYLFETALERACTQAGLVDQEGKPMVTAHRFRHTVGTELAEGGARLHTIMKMLGHTSTEMTLVYAHISDKAMAEDYHRVLGPGAELAGPLAEQLCAGTLPEESVEWLKTNFFKTELELGHCLRLPQEGPCECDLYLSCAKFVTTREYAPRLRSRRLRELELIEDAASQGWDREVERHRCTVKRIEQLLEELGEPLEMIEEVQSLEIRRIGCMNPCPESGTQH